MFTLCDDETPKSPLPILRRLLIEAPEMAELNSMLDVGCTVAFMLRAAEEVRDGKQNLGYCAFPSVQGKLRPMFEWLLEDRLGYLPTWIIILDEGFWLGASDIQREALLFHELKHAGQAVDKYGSPIFNAQTGMPKPTIKPHDLEEFSDVVRRYGAWKSDIQDFLDACQ